MDFHEPPRVVMRTNHRWAREIFARKQRISAAPPHTRRAKAHDGRNHFARDDESEHAVTEPALPRRTFLALIGAGTSACALSAPAGCSKRVRSKGSAASAAQVAAVIPKYKPLELVKPDFPGEGPVPHGYLHYPNHLVDAITDKPGTTGRAIKTMSPSWGPTPPGLGRNSYLAAINGRLGVPVNPSMQDGNTYAEKLNAMLGARDIPDLLSVPSWEVDKIPRFSQAVKALFADLTDYLKGDAADAYPMLAALPTVAWQYSVWSGRLAAIPFPGGPFPWALFYRKDLTDRAGVAVPKSIDELYDFGVRMTNPGKGVWAFGNVFNIVQMLFKCPGVKGGWRKKVGGGLEFKLETLEFRQAVEFTSRLFKEGLVHPDLVASKGADAKQLFSAGKMIAWEDGLGAWKGMRSEQAKVTPGFDMQAIPLFSAVGGEPLAWGSEEPIFYTFLKKGLGQERTEELLRVLNWCAAPFGSKEYELCLHGVEGEHFTRAADNSPVPTDLFTKELAMPPQYFLLGGRGAVEVATADVPSHVHDLLAYMRATLPHLEPDLFRGIKLELPPSYSKTILTSEDKLNDILRNRRPLGDLDQLVKEWRTNGGDDARAFLEKTLTDNGR
jgi:putative aldouronate transport system substrate-binding protein